MVCFDIKSFINIIETMIASNDPEIFNDLIGFLIDTQIYRNQNFKNKHERVEPGTVSKILNHKRGLFQDIKMCAELIDLESRDFEQIKISFSDIILDPLDSNANKGLLAKKVLYAIDLDNTISKTNKEKFRKAAEQDYAIFLTKVLLYLFSNDPQPEKENLDIESQKAENNAQELKVDITSECRQSQLAKNKNAQLSSTKSNIISPENIINKQQTTTPVSTDCDQAHKQFNIFATIHNSKKNHDRLYPDEIHLNHYNLFVIGKEEFKEGISLIKSVTDERFTDPDIKEKTDTSENLRKDILLRHPSLFIPYGQDTDISAQLAYIGFVDKYTEEFGNLIIYWHYIAELPARYIRAWRDRLGIIDMEYNLTELDIPHWAVKNIDLFHAIRAFLPDSLPKIPETNALLRTITLKYNGFYKGVSLEFVYYYYGDNGPHNTKMTKTLQLPVFINNRTLDEKEAKFIFDKYSISTDLEFTNTLPHISLLTDFLPEMEAKYIPMIKATPVILGNNLNWHCCELFEEGDHLVVMPSSAQNEADNIDQSIGELIDAILYWANKKRIINKQEAIEQFIYLTY